MVDSSARQNYFDPPDSFVELVRDALLHLYNLTYLQSHQLLIADAGGPAIKRSGGQQLRQTLLDTIEALRPGPGVAATSRAWRLYRILEQRYIEGHDVSDIIQRIALSRAQYHREHHRSLQEIALLLWERWNMGDRWATFAGSTDPRGLTSLELTKVEAERLQPGEKSERIDVSETLRGVLEVLRPLCFQQAVVIKQGIAADLPPIRGERVALRHALLSILARATRVSSGHALGVTAECQPGTVDIQISGQSTGLLDPDTLGLSAGQPFVKALNGHLTFTTDLAKPGDWTVVLSFPVGDHSTLIVVDNNADFIRLVERYLVGHHWDVIGVSDVEQATGLIQQHHPRLVLLDVIIPGRDGWDLLLELRSSPSTANCPVIICSVLHEPEVAISLGATAYLQKPINQLQLVDAVEPFR